MSGDHDLLRAAQRGGEEGRRGDRRGRHDARVREQRLEPRPEVLIEHPHDEAEILPRAAGGESAVQIGDVVLLDDRERGRRFEAGVAQVGDVPAIAFEHADVHLLEPGAKPRLEPLAEHDDALAERDQLLGEPDRDPV